MLAHKRSKLTVSKRITGSHLLCRDVLVFFRLAGTPSCCCYSLFFCVLPPQPCRKSSTSLQQHSKLKDTGRWGRQTRFDAEGREQGRVVTTSGRSFASRDPVAVLLRVEVTPLLIITSWSTTTHWLMFKKVCVQWR